MTIFALIVAAGSGARFQVPNHGSASVGEKLPKQFELLNTKSVLSHAIEAFEAHPKIDKIIILVHPDYVEQVKALRADYAKISHVVHGGASRQQSVYNGLDALRGEINPADAVLVHDAARPMVSAELIDRVVDGVTQCGSAVPALAVTDTLKHASDGHKIERTVPRDGLYRVQTPQGFRFELLDKAHAHGVAEKIIATDDASLVEAMGEPVMLVEGTVQNIKVTHFEDLERLRQMMQQKTETRTGIGYDVHAIAPEKDAIILCGITLAHEFGLKGHSDADVAMHALTDAIYGALAEGDIGQHFPPTDPAHKDKDSEIFLDHAVNLVREHNGRIIHLDLTILAEAPKIGPHSDEMSANIARICGISEKRVSIKATTSEKLGFVGRQEGLAAMAAATIEVPQDV